MSPIRMAEAVKDGAGAEERHRARQRLWRFRGAANGYSPSRNRNQTHSRRLRCCVFGERAVEAFRNMAAASSAKGLQRSPTSRCAGCLRRNFRQNIPT